MRALRQAKIQKFSSGGRGSNLPKKFEKKRERGEGGGGSINSALVWLQSDLAMETAFQTIAYIYMALPGIFLITQKYI